MQKELEISGKNIEDAIEKGNACGDSGIDVTLSDRARKIRRILHE